jgi:hypothetical protein
MTAVARRLDDAGARVFSCDVARSPGYLAARGGFGSRHEAWSFALLRETLTPYYNLGAGVSTALSLDLTMLTPRARVASPEEAACGDMGALAPRLRAAGVTHVLSLDPLEGDDLAPEAVLQPAAVRPLAVHLYALREPRPLVEASGPVRVLAERAGLVEAEAEGALVVRQTAAEGWRATVLGREAPLAATESGHLTIAAGPARGRVRLEYRPPGLVAGVVVSLASVLVFVFLIARRES